MFTAVPNWSYEVVGRVRGMGVGEIREMSETQWGGLLHVVRGKMALISFLNIKFEPFGRNYAS